MTAPPFFESLEADTNRIELTGFDGQEIAVRQLQIFKFAVIIFLSAHWVYQLLKSNICYIIPGSSMHLAEDVNTPNTLSNTNIGSASLKQVVHV